MRGKGGRDLRVKLGEAGEGEAIIKIYDVRKKEIFNKRGNYSVKYILYNMHYNYTYNLLSKFKDICFL